MQLLQLSTFSSFCVNCQSLVKLIICYNDNVIKIHRKYYCRDMAEQYIAEN